MPSTYKPQVQGCIWLAEVDSWDFLSFDPRLPGASQAMIVTVSRDQDYIDTLESEVDRFVSEMLDLEARLRGDVEAVEAQT